MTIRKGVFVIGVSLLLAQSFGCHSRSAINTGRLKSQAAVKGEKPESQLAIKGKKQKKSVEFSDLRQGMRVRIKLDPKSKVPYSREFKVRGFECFVRRIESNTVWVDMIKGLVEFEIPSKDIRSIEYLGLEFEESLIEWPALYIPATLTALLLLMGQ